MEVAPLVNLNAEKICNGFVEHRNLFAVQGETEEPFKFWFVGLAESEEELQTRLGRWTDRRPDFKQTALVFESNIIELRSAYKLIIDNLELSHSTYDDTKKAQFMFFYKMIDVNSPWP